MTSLQELLRYVGRHAFGRRPSLASGLILAPVRETLAHRLGLEAGVPQGE